MRDIIIIGETIQTVEVPSVGYWWDIFGVVDNLERRNKLQKSEQEGKMWEARIVELKKRPDYADVERRINEEKRTPGAVDAINYIYGLMSPLVGDRAAKFATLQSGFETNNWTDPKWTQHNNGSGITYAHQTGSVKQPTGFPYAWFNTRQNWAKAFAHELTKGANPAGATSLADYVARLKKNGYMQASESAYLSGLEAMQRRYQQWHTDTQPAPKGPGIQNEWDKLPWYGKGAVIAAGLFVAGKIFSR